MIIQCIKCNKNFDVNSELIPSKGRTIQCGSCNHIWFYKRNNESFSDKKSMEKSKISTITKTYDEIKEKPNQSKKTRNTTYEKNEKIKSKKFELTQYKKKSNFTFSKFLSLIIVMIISFVAIIIVIDTFKSPLYKLYPNLEIILFNFYEVIKDIELFIKDLIYND